MFRHALKRAMANVGGAEQGFIGYTTFSSDTQFFQTVDIAIPSGSQEGDLLIIAMSTDTFWSVTEAGLTTAIASAGLSLYPEHIVSTTLGAGICVMYKTIGASESSPLSISFGSGLDSDEGAQNLVVHAMLFRGLTLNTSGTLPALVSSSGTAPTYNATTATNAVDDIVLTVASLDDDIGISLTSPSSGYTTIGFDESSTSGGTSGQASTLLTQYKVLTSTATESPSSPTLSGFDDAYATLTLQLQVARYNYETDFGTPTYTITTFPSQASGVNGGTNDVLIAIDANISSTDDGVLMELGGTASGLSIGVSNNSLRFRCIDGSTAWTSIVDANTAYFDIDISAYTGTFCTYYFVVDYSAKTAKAYVQVGGKGSTNDIVLLDTNTASSASTNVYGGAAKGYGTQGTDASMPDLEAAYEVNFTGTIDEIRYWAEDAALDVSTFGT